MTNFEKIKNMSAEDLAHDLNLLCAFFGTCYECPFMTTICSSFEDVPDWLQWLESEADTEQREGERE